MPNDLSHSLAPSFEGLPSNRLDDPGVVAAVTKKLFAELNPASNFAKVIALDIIQVELDVMRLRQAKSDVADGALKAELASLLYNGQIKIGFHHGRLKYKFQLKLVADVIRGRPGVARRLETVLRYYGETPSGLRARAFRRHMDVSQKIDAQLERLERRRRNLRRDLDLYQSARAQVIEAESVDA